MTGPVRQLGRARDLVTAPDGTTAAVVAEAEMHVVIDFAAGMLVGEITMEPAVDGLDAFVGARAAAGSGSSSTSRRASSAGRSPTSSSTTYPARRSCRATR